MRPGFLFFSFLRKKAGGQVRGLYWTAAGVPVPSTSQATQAACSARCCGAGIGIGRDGIEHCRHSEAVCVGHGAGGACRKANRR